MDQQEPSREQIAASLASRDPAWFRQTSDRGVGSAALRKTQDEEGAGDSFAIRERELIGLSQELPKRTERLSSQSNAASLRGSVRDSTSSRVSGETLTSTASKPDLKSLVAADELQIQASPMSDHGSSNGDANTTLTRTLTMSSSQARLGSTTDRPNSPTKGMGGFVQSAMMKRSDSVNKRWSAQPGASLSRQNSLASVRSGFGGLQGSHSMPRLEPTGKETSNESTSRPSSSSSNLKILTAAQDDNDGFVKPALPHHNRSKSVVSSYSTNAEDSATSPPSSPSKRFSPTKSSWIESALTRPDSPKPAALKINQPSWMANIAKAKAERASADSTPRTGTPLLPDPVTPRSVSPSKPTPFGQGMLKRSDSRDLAPTPRSSTPPFMREKPEAVVQAQPDTTESVTENNFSIAKHDQPPSRENTTQTPIQDNTADERDVEAGPEPKSEPEGTLIRQKAYVEPPKTTKPPPRSPVPSVAKPKQEAPSKPPTDFRGALRSRAPPDTKKQDTPEFLSRFGNLRKTQAEKFVAPDLLKDSTYFSAGKGLLRKLR